MIPKKILVLQLAVLAVLIVCAFFNAQHQSFKMDDHDTFKDPKIINPAFWKYNWIPEPNRYLKLSIASEESGFRPVTNSLLAVIYQFFGNQVSYYHTMSLLLLLVGCVLFYFLVLSLSKDAFLAFLSSSLFALHPINGLAVNYVVAYAYGLQLVMAMLSLVLFAKSLELSRPILLISLSSIFFILALGVHETSIVMPIYLFCMAWMVGRLSLFQSFIRTIPFFVVLFTYLLFRFQYASLKTGVIEKYLDFQMSIAQFLATYVKIVTWYLSQLFLPDGVVLMWSSKILEHNLGGWLLWGGGLVIVGGVGLFRLGRSFLSWSLVVFILGFFPILGACLFRPTTGLVMEPHWMFIASTGFFILLAYILKKIMGHKYWVGGVLIVLLLTGYLRLTHLYNDLWKDEKIYCLYWLEKVPTFTTTELFLANAFMQEENYGQARYYLNRAKEGIFSDWQIYTNLGLMDFDQGKFDAAIENYQKALSINPDAAEVYNNLALIFEKTGRLQEAVRNNQRALSLNRMLVEPRLNLARIALANDDLKTAVQLYQENLHYFPLEIRSYQLYLTALLDAGELDGAHELVQELIKKCKSAAMLTQTGNLLVEKHQLVWALDLYMQAIRVNPRFKDVYIHAGILLAQLNETDQAVQLWQEALRIDTNDKQVADLIKNAKIKQQTSH